MGNFKSLFNLVDVHVKASEAAVKMFPAATLDSSVTSAPFVEPTLGLFTIGKLHYSPTSPGIVSSS